MALRSFLRRVGITLDRDSAGKYMTDFERTLAASGDKGARAMQRALKESLNLTLAQLNKDLANKIIDEKTFHRLKAAAERGFVDALSKGMDRLKAAGKLTDAEMVRLAKDLERVGRSANQSTAELSRMERGGLSLGKIFGAGGVFALGMGTVHALGNGLRRLKDFLVDSVKESVEADSVWDHLGATVSNLGLRFETVRPQLEAVVAQLKQKFPQFDDEEIAAGLDALAAGTRNLTWSQRNLGTVLDISAKYKMKAADAADLLAKVYNGNTRVLRGLNIVVGEHETGLQAVRRATAGYAENEAQKLSGQIDAAVAGWGDLKEAIGGALTAAADGPGALSPLIDALDTATKKVEGNRDEVARWARLFATTLVAVGRAVIAAGRLLGQFSGGIQILGADLATGAARVRLWAGYVKLGAYEATDGLRRAIDRMVDFVSKIPAPIRRLLGISDAQISNWRNKSLARELGIEQARRDVAYLEAALRRTREAAQEIREEVVGANVRAGERPDASGGGGGGGGGEDPAPTGDRSGRNRDADMEFLRQLQEVLKLRDLNRRELARVLEMEARYDRQVREQTGSLKEQAAAAEKLRLIRNELAPAVRLAQTGMRARIPDRLGADPTPDASTAAVDRMLAADARAAAAHKQAMADATEGFEFWKNQWLDGHAQMIDATQNLAGAIVDSMGEALVLIITGAGSAGDAVKNMFKGMARALAVEVGKMASVKVSENIAQGFEWLAKASGYATAQMYLQAAQAKRTAAGHFVSALKWAGVAALAGGAAGALSGGGGGGAVAGGDGRDRRPSDEPETRRFAYPRGAGGAAPDFSTRDGGVTVVIHQRIDGFTPNRPEHQDAWVEGGRLALERHGKGGLGLG